VPGAVHITDTHAGHNIMIDNAPVGYPGHPPGRRCGESRADLGQNGEASTGERGPSLESETRA
jgi:hypothetical protein